MSMKNVHTTSGHLLVTIYYLRNPKPDLFHTVIRAFCKAAPRLWNRLPRDIRHSKSINRFKCSLKTHLFKTAFNL